MTQCEKILDYMDRHGSITTRDAFFFGCTRLAARIYEIEKDGWPIDREYVTVKNADGSESSVKRYWKRDAGDSKRGTAVAG